MRRLAPCVLAALLARGAAADGMNGPWEAPAGAASGPAARQLHPETRPEVLAAAGAIRLFQRLVSPVDGPRCHLVPTCSEFGRLAVRRYGLLLGAILTAGRLMRDNASAAGFYRRALIGDRVVLYDPPEDHWPPGGKAKGKRQEAKGKRRTAEEMWP